jgi:hypothetical protein
VNTGEAAAPRADLAVADDLFAATAMTRWRERANAMEVRLRIA